MKKLYLLLVFVLLLSSVAIMGCAATTVTQTTTVLRTVTQEGSTSTVTTTAQPVTVSETAPAVTVFSTPQPVNQTVTTTQTQPPETVTTSLATTITETALLQDQVFRMISAQEAYDLIQDNLNNPKFMIIDVNPPDYYAEGHIEGAVNIPIESTLAQFAPLDRCGTYLLICRTGLRSSYAIEDMMLMGFYEFYDVSGGYNSWTGIGLPVVTSP